ncbi:Uncharacterised protein, partial [Mycoplasmopsis edwardii]
MLTFDDKVTDEILQKLFNKVASSKSIVKKYVDTYKKFYNMRFGSKMQEW